MYPNMHDRRLIQNLHMYLCYSAWIERHAKYNMSDLYLYLYFGSGIAMHTTIIYPLQIKRLGVLTKRSRIGNHGVHVY